MTDDTSACFIDTLDKSFEIVRVDSLQINNFTAHAEFLFGEFRCSLDDSDLSAPCDESDVSAFLDDFCYVEIEFVIHERDLLFCRAVESFRLEEDHWVFVSDTREKKSLALHRVTGDDNLQAGCVCEVCLRGLRVVQRAVANCTPVRADRQRTTVELVARSEAIFSCFVHDLIECGEDVVTELDLSDCGDTDAGETNAECGDTLLAERSVEHTLRAVLLVQT